MSNPKSDWKPYREKEAQLREVEARLAREPGALAHRFEQARLLTELGRAEEAKTIYREILLQDPSQFVALNNLGSLLLDTGYRTAAITVYRQTVAHHPNNPIGHVNLANALYAAREFKEARAHYETVLRLVPDHIGAHQGLSYVLMDLFEEDASWEHQQKGFEKQPVKTFRYRGEKEPVRILFLLSPRGGNAPLQRYLDDKIFMTSQVMTDFYEPSIVLPEHHLIINAIGDADRASASLDAAERVLKQTTAPLLNPPARIRTTGRAENARILGAIEGVITPRMTTLSRETLAGSDAAAVLAREGFSFPILLRTPGFHGGDYFQKVESSQGMEAALALLLGSELTVIEYLDARAADGKVRKYRVMMIDGKLYPLHAAVSADWKIHYFSADMVNSPEHRAEDAAFLQDMPRVLGPRAMKALEQIRDALGLDYAGADFSLSPNGDLFLFEANATMTVPRPENGAQWDYRRGPVETIHTAVREMILGRIERAKTSA